MKKRTSIYDLPEYDSYDRITVYTDKKGLAKREYGESFYVWTTPSDSDIPLLMFGKDIGVDSNANIYCVDGLDTILID